MKNHEQLFIIGAPRSGTTYLASLLENSRFKTPIETHYIIKYKKKLDKYEPLSKQKNLSKLVNDISKERPVRQHNKNLDIIKANQQISSSNTYYQVVNEINTALVDNQKNCCWGDKTPHYLRELETLIEMFPDAYYIFIVRDGRDVALSLLEKPWGPNNLLSCATYWRDLNEKFITHHRKIPEEKLLFIKYEELISKLPEHINKIFEFINEEKETLDKVLKSFTEPKRNNSNKWKKKLSSKQQETFESQASSVLKWFDYECVYDNPRTPHAIIQYYKLHDRIMRYAFLLKHNIIDGAKIKLLGKQPFNE